MSLGRTRGLAVRTLVVALLLCGRPAGAQTSYPMVTRVQPVAVQRGQTAEVTIAGSRNFAGASALLFEGTGLSAKVLDATAKAEPTRSRRGTGNGAVRANVTVAPDAALGPREVRVVTPRGVSTIGMLVVVAEPVVTEADDKANDQPAGAQAITLPATITGAIGKVEDVDWFSFRAEAGQRVAFSLWGNRLQDKVHDLQTHLDPILVLFDSRGRELAADDNTLFADPLLVHEFQESGTYLIQVRDVTYAGNPNWTYSLLATTGPFARSVFPMAVRPGSRAELRASGINLDPSRPILLDVPAEARPGPLAVPLPTDRGPTPPVPLVVTDLPLAIESGDASAEPDQAQAIATPVALSGRLGEANDVDAYRFEARKGKSYLFEVTARRAGSTTDPVLRVVNDQGRVLNEADDTLGKDPRLEWNAPADGTFAVQVTDLHSRGGDGFGYVLTVDEARPDFALTGDPDKLNVGRGGRTPLFVKVERRSGFDGPVTLDWDGLPPGVSASPLTLAPKQTQGLIVVSADADAPLAAVLPTLVGRGEGKDGPIERAISARQEIYLPGGGRGLYPVATFPLAVTEPSDITVEAQPSEITLRPGQAATIEVKVARREGYDGPVNLAVDLSHLNQVFASALPAGVVLKQAGSKTLLGPKESVGRIVLEAKPNAPPCDGVTMAVLGHVSINFVVKTTFCSAPIKVSVLPKP